MPLQVWEGVYSDWDTAVAAAQDGHPPIFDSDEWLDKVADQLRTYRADLGSNTSTLPPRPSNLPWLCALTSPRTIVDLGGSSGWTWDYVRDSLPSLDLETYVIVETKTLVDAFGRSGEHGPPVVYATDAGAVERCDILYSNSVLQYFPSNDPLLDLIGRLEPAHVLLDDVFAGSNPEFFSVQHYYESKIPCRFLNLERLEDEVRGLGYSLLARVPFDTPTLGRSQPKPMDNFPKTHRLRYSIATLFARNE